MYKLLIFIVATILIASCTKDTLEPNTTDSTESSFVEDQASGEQELVQDIKQLDFDAAAFLTALHNQSSYTFTSNPFTTIQEKSFKFNKLENSHFSEDESIQIESFEASSDEVSVYAWIANQSSIWVSIYSPEGKFVITNSHESADGLVYYQDESYIQKTKSEAVLKSNVYEVDLWVFADKGWVTSPRPNTSISHVMYLYNAVRDASQILESQLPIDIDPKMWLTPHTDHMWDENTSTYSTYSKFLDMLNNPSIYSTKWGNTMRARIRNADIILGVSGYNPNSYFRTISTAPITGYCGVTSAANFMCTIPSRTVFNKRTIATEMAQSLGADQNNTTPNMMNTSTSGSLREHILQSTKTQILNKLQSSSCID